MFAWPSPTTLMKNFVGIVVAQKTLAPVFSVLDSNLSLKFALRAGTLRYAARPLASR